MNVERLAELKERAEKVTKLAALLDDLKNADPFAAGNLVRFHRHGSEILCDEVVTKIFAEGLLKVTAEIEAELEMLLASDYQPQS